MVEDKKLKAHSLIDKVYRWSNLASAWKKVKSNKGAGGVDKVSIEQFERRKETYFQELYEKLKGDRYYPLPVRRVYIPKPDGRKRPLGIPTIRDRVVQQALLNKLEPIFEKKFHNSSFGYRPGKSPHLAMRRIWKELRGGNRWIVEVDIRHFFDTIEHERLIDFVAEEVADGRVLELIRRFLKAKVSEDYTLIDVICGTPQGGVISPLLANIYLNHLDRKWEEEGIEKKIGASLIRYADDFIIVSRHSEKWLLSRVRGILERELLLRINEDKSKVVDVEKEAVRFLGFEIRLVKSRRSGRKFALMYPSKKAMTGLYERIRAIANPRMPVAIEVVVARLNRLLRGWVNYFRIGHASKWFNKVRYYVEKKVRRYIRSVRNKTGYGWKGISGEYLYKDLGLYNDYRVSWRRA